MDLALGLTGFTEGKAPAVIVNDSDATVENRLSGTYHPNIEVTNHHHFPYPFLKMNRSETVCLLMIYGVSHRKSGV